MPSSMLVLGRLLKKYNYKYNLSYYLILLSMILLSILVLCIATYVSVPHMKVAQIGINLKNVVKVVVFCSLWFVAFINN